MDNRKTQIVNLSVDLIREKGYVAFSYDDIAKKLGVTKASIHYHFEKKEDLALAVTDKLQQSLQNLMLLTSNPSIPVEEKIQRFITKQIEIGGNGICPISSLQSDYESLPANVQIKVKELSQFGLSSLMTILKEAQNEGIVKSDANVESLAYVVLSCIKGGMQYNRVLQNDMMPRIMEQINIIIRC